MKEKKYTYFKKETKESGSWTFKTDKYIDGSWLSILGKRYILVKWEKTSNLIDSSKEVVLVEWRTSKEKSLIEPNDVMDMVIKLGLDAGVYDQPYVGVDSCGFSSNKDFDLSLFFIVKENSIRISIIVKNKKARNKLDKALKCIGNL